MGVNEFLDSFRCLGPLERQDALARLATEVNIWESWSLRNTLNSIDVRTDIVGRLPVELVVMVFSYLNHKAPLRLQRVSKEWQRILSLPDFASLTLRSWYGSEWGKICSRDPAWRRQKVEQLHRFMNFRPHSKQVLWIPRSHKTLLEHPDHHDRLNPDGLIATLVGDTFIYALPEARELRICNIRTGNHWATSTLAREQITSVEASDELFAFLTFRFVYVYTISGDKSRRMAIPTANPTVTCNGRAFAIASCAGACSKLGEPTVVTVGVWSIDKPEGRSFQAQRLTDSDWYRYGPVVALPDAQLETVTVFSVERTLFSPQQPRGTKNLIRIHFTRHRISDGELCGESQHPIHCFGFDFTLQSIRSVGVPNYYVLTTKDTACPFASEDGTRPLIWNDEAFRFEDISSPYQWRRLPDCPSLPKFSCRHGGPRLNLSPGLPVPSPGLSRGLQMFQMQLNQERHAAKWWEPNAITAHIGPPRQHCYTQVWVNETFVVCRRSHVRRFPGGNDKFFASLTVYCFEKGWSMPGEAKTFLQDENARPGEYEEELAKSIP